MRTNIVLAKGAENVFACDMCNQIIIIYAEELLVRLEYFSQEICPVWNLVKLLLSMLKNFLFVKLLKRKLLPSLKSFATLSRLHLAHFARLLLKPWFQASLNGSTKISNILKSASISDFVAHLLKQRRLFVSQERSNT